MTNVYLYNNFAELITGNILISENIRKQQMRQVVCQWLQCEHADISMIAGDASFRKYYRARTSKGSWVLMDAPPELEDCSAFIEITDRLRTAGLHAPEIFQIDLKNGFLLLEDLGDQQYKPLISLGSDNNCLEPLFKTLEKLAQKVNCKGLPPYNQSLLQAELDLFPDWYLSQHLHCPFSVRQQLVWEQVCNLLIKSALQQPQVFVHRDFHSCNLMKTKNNNPGIIDYQDAVLGPLSYDLASLLWDRYISWPRQQIVQWCEHFHQRFDLDIPLQEWQQQCDWMGLQRNLKVVGIFARLHYRDQKAGYLQMLPRFWSYCLDILQRYSQFDELSAILQQDKFQPGGESS